MTIQGQILFEVQKLCQDTGTALIWITHDLAVVAGLADRVAVMYAGRVVETGTTEAVISHPMHPYTHGLIASIPTPESRGRPLEPIPGMTLRCSTCRKAARSGAAARATPVWPSPSRRKSVPANGCAAGTRERAMTHDATTPILSLRGVELRFVQPVDLAGRIANLLGAGLKTQVVHAVAGVDLDVMPGEVIGIVGESGCGKSTLGRIVSGILPPSAGELRYRGKPVQGLPGPERRAYELGVQMIFQDPYASLNPRMRVREIIGEAPVAHKLVAARDKADYVAGLMRQVGLDPGYAQRYPHQFSGGQRQRIGIARALALKPSVIVCDEAVAALVVQAQVLNLFERLRGELDLTYLFISHNLSVVSHISDRVAIMYLGRVVELAPTDEIFQRANHPYTQALLKELPTLTPGRRAYRPIRASCRRRWIRRPAAPSIRAVRRPCRAARPKGPCCARSRGMSAPVI